MIGNRGHTYILHHLRADPVVEFDLTKVFPNTGNCHHRSSIIHIVFVTNGIICALFQSRPAGCPYDDFRFDCTSLVGVIVILWSAGAIWQISIVRMELGFFDGIIVVICVLYSDFSPFFS